MTVSDAAAGRFRPVLLAAAMAARAATWEQVGDGRAVFLDCYARMTDAVVTAVRNDRFVDGDWVLLLLERFAAYYDASIDGGPGGLIVPEPWVLAHAAAVGNDAHPMQLLLAGVNAHINYDLVLTLIDLLEPEWRSIDDAVIERRQLDYDEINQVIAETADLVQDRVLERRVPWLQILDRGLGRWDERMAVRLLGGWRTRVWRQSVTLLELNDPDDRRAHTEAIERQCARRARLLLA
jgi:hypothetical protein